VPRLAVAVVAAVVLVTTSAPACVPRPEQGDECGNGHDDDGDDLIDCDDPNCKLLPVCAPVAADLAPASCGNRVVEVLEQEEQCDDGNRRNGDGCSSTCEAERSPTCGNFQLDEDPATGSFEECDDGNRQSGDGCSSSCRFELCGDGIVQPTIGEQCDDATGADVNCEGCVLVER
jgi:cysteine-rich repeat protein